MKKLRNKVFFVIFSILSLILLIILVYNNYNEYMDEKSEVKKNLNFMDSEKDDNNKPSSTSNTVPEKPSETSSSDGNQLQEGDPPKENEDDDQTTSHVMIMDMVVYTVILDDDLTPSRVINHSTTDVDKNEIKQIASDILASDNLKEMYIGNLYYTKYSYSYNGNNKLILVDNTEVIKSLRKSLLNSALIFVGLDCIIILVSAGITLWITKPVESAFKKQKQFIADASHELKTPLAVIMASSDSLSNSPDEKKWLDNIKSESERMNKLVTNLLELARSEHDSLKNDFSINNISKIIEKSVLTFEGIIYENGINLDYEIEENIELKSDSDKIKQLMSILLDNAIQHTKKEGDIIVTLKKQKKEIILEVKNSGEAILKGEEEKIFERFYRIDKSRNRNDNRYGLGLAIAKNIVENHNGKIIAFSQNGYTTFRTTLKDI